MGKRTRPQGWEKPTYFMYSLRIQKIYQKKASQLWTCASNGGDRQDNRAW